MKNQLIPFTWALDVEEDTTTVGMGLFPAGTAILKVKLLAVYEVEDGMTKAKATQVITEASTLHYDRNLSERELKDLAFSLISRKLTDKGMLGI